MGLGEPQQAEFSDFPATENLKNEQVASHLPCLRDSGKHQFRPNLK
jgi:hypothetical protein